MALPLDHLDLLDEPVQAACGVPLSLPVADIDEDPAQPRQDFDQASLLELAETIRRARRAPTHLRAPPPRAVGTVDAELRRAPAARIEARRQAGDSCVRR